MYGTHNQKSDMGIITIEIKKKKEGIAGITIEKRQA